MGTWKVIKKSTGIVAFTIAMALLLAGCGQGNSNGTGGKGQFSEPVKASPNSSSSSGNGSSAAQTTYPLTIKDDSGTAVTLEKSPQRIISIIPSETEMLFALGVGDKIVAVDNYSDFPDAAKSKPKIGDISLNVEALLAQKPDIVFANSSVNKKQMEQLRALNVKVFGSDPKTIDEVIDRVELYGKLLNKADEAKKVTDTMKAERQKVLDAVKGVPTKKVYIEFSPGYTIGSGVYMHDLIMMAGGVNIMADQKEYVKVDPEAIIKANPDVILYAQGAVTPEELKRRPGWDKIAAIKNGKLYAIDDNLLSRVSPRITKALIEVGKAIQPDKVK
jgi:iron complex transport system substrate-binding protein